MGELTIAGFFSSIGEIVSGLITGAVNVFTGLWESGIPGQIVCGMGFATMVMGLGFSIFHISKKRKRK